ncbi:MAG TPA: Pycsar system effector family protein [Candidatus Paceibacterota bacterium]
MPKEKLAESTAEFLDGTLQKSYSFAQHLDTQTNILVGVSMAVFLFSLSQLTREIVHAPFVVLTLFAGVSAFIGLFAIHPPRFMRKRGQQESLMYHKHILSFDSPEKYGKALEETIEDRIAMIHQYATEIYNVSKYYYRPKRKLFHLARNILIIGFFFALVTFIFDLVL